MIHVVDTMIGVNPAMYSSMIESLKETDDISRYGYALINYNNIFFYTDISGLTSVNLERIFELRNQYSLKFAVYFDGISTPQNQEFYKTSIVIYNTLFNSLFDFIFVPLEFYANVLINTFKIPEEKIRICGIQFPKLNSVPVPKRKIVGIATDYAGILLDAYEILLADGIKDIDIDLYGFDVSNSLTKRIEFINSTLEKSKIRLIRDNYGPKALSLTDACIQFVYDDSMKFNHFILNSINNNQVVLVNESEIYNELFSFDERLIYKDSDHLSKMILNALSVPLNQADYINDMRGEIDFEDIQEEE